jgi:hypothetical protein
LECFSIEPFYYAAVQVQGARKDSLVGITRITRTTRARSGGGKAKSDGKVAVGGTERKKAPPIPFSFTRVGIPPLLIFIII